ncbi:MAG: hypothetical protein AAB036_09545 [Elusimicrobiota bacterium]
MKSRLTAAIFTTLCVMNTTLASAGAKTRGNKNQPQTLLAIAQYVLDHGVDKGIKAPNSHMLGYQVDVLMTKALRQKKDIAPDNQEHSFHVILSTDPASPRAIDAIILSHVRVTDKDGRKHVDLMDAKITPTGELLVLLHVTGFPGSATRTALDVKTKKALVLYKTELEYQLTQIDYRSIKK